MTTQSRTGGQILVDQLVVHGVEHVFCVPGESYLAVLDALHDAAIAVTVCRQEGGAAMMAEAYGKLTGRPGICFVTRGPGATNASPGIHIAHAGFDADDPVRRPDRARHARARGVPGARLQRRVRHHGQMGDRDRRCRRASPSWSRAPSMSRRSGRPGPGRHRAAGGHADRGGERRRRAALRSRSRPSLARARWRDLQKLLWAAKRPIAILGGSRWSRAGGAALRALRRALRAAGRRPRSAARCCSRPTTRAMPAISASAPTRSCSRASRTPTSCCLVGGRMSEMPSQSYTLLDIPTPRQTLVHVHPDAGRARPRLPSAACDQRLADGLLGRARGPPAARTTSPGREETEAAHAELPRLDRSRRNPPSRRASRWAR